MTKSAKIISVVLAAILILIGLSFSASAQTGDRYRLSDEGNWIAVGGLNEWDEIKATSRSETQELESTLVNNNYILITSDQMSISEEEYETFKEGHSFWFSGYMENKKPDWDVYRVYVYKPSYIDYMAQLSSESGRLQRYTLEELNNSTVVIDYQYWDIEEAIGTVTDKFNDNIPEYSESGYLQINSPVDCEVTILQAYTKQYYKFYVRKNTPFLVRVVVGCYHIVGVNAQNIPDNIDNDGEATLPYNNQIQIGSHHTAEAPYVIELNELVDKYDVPDINIDGLPDYSIIGNNDKFVNVEIDIPEEKTTIHDTEADERTEQDNEPQWFLWVIVISIAILGIALVIIYVRKEFSDDDFDHND